MIRKFAARSPKTAAVVIYLGGYLAGSLLAALVGRLISWSSNTGTVLGSERAAERWLSHGHGGRGW
jgi:hypothetical protein